MRYNENMNLIILTILTVLIGFGYSVYVFKNAPDQLWNWYHGLVATLLSIMLGVVAGFLVYYHQKAYENRTDTETTRILLQQELSHLKRLLATGDRATITIDTTTYSPLIISLQPLALEKAAQSGHFDPIETANMLHIAGKIRTYNLQVQFLLTTLNASNTDQGYQSRLKFVLSNLEAARKALLNDIEFEAKKLNISLIDMNK